MKKIGGFVGIFLCAAFGSSTTADPLVGEVDYGKAVSGIARRGTGVSGSSEKWLGVYGESQEGEGVRGVGHKGAGVSASSDQWIGVFGTTKSPGAAGGEFQNTGG